MFWYVWSGLNPHDTFSDSSDEEVIVIKNSDNDVYASSSSSPASTGFSTTHNEVAHCPKALVNSVGHSTLAVADDNDSNNAYCEIKPRGFTSFLTCLFLYFKLLVVANIWTQNNLNLYFLSGVMLYCVKLGRCVTITKALLHHFLVCCYACLHRQTN